MKRYLILGAGIAGRRAAELIRKRDPDVEVVLVEEQSDPFYYRPMLGELLAGKIRQEHVIARDRDRFSQLGVKTLTNVKVESLDVASSEAVLSNGEKLGYDRVLIATGRRTVRLACDVGAVSGVAYLDTLPQTREIASALDSVQKAVVYGASLQSLNAIRGLRGRGIDCTLVLPEQRFWEGVLDPVASEVLETRLENERVSIVKDSTLEELVEDEGRLLAVVTSRGEKVPADALIVGAPQAPVLDFLQESDLATEEGVPVNDRLMSAVENVFAAGDVAVLPAASHGAVPLPGWLSAWRQGNFAGLNMAGGTNAYTGIPSLRTKALDMDVVCLGMSDARGDGFREESGDYPYEELPYIYKKVAFKERRAAGALFLGDTSEAGAVEKWIRLGLHEDECDKQVLDQIFQPRVHSFRAIGALCPVCKFQIQVEEGVEEGTVHTCPACGMDFRLHRMPNGVFRAEVAA